MHFREQDLNYVKVLQRKAKPAILILAIWTGLPGLPVALIAVEEVKDASLNVQKKKMDLKGLAKKWAWILNTLNISLNATLGTSQSVPGKLELCVKADDGNSAVCGLDIRS